MTTGPRGTATFVERRIGEFDRIPQDRKDSLDTLAEYVRERRAAGNTARLTFICTHNSRRSHMAHLWAWAAAAHHGIDRVETYSGGTEATAFDPRAVAAMQRAGFRIDSRQTDTDNPRYTVRYDPQGPAVEAFSKVYHQPPNPSEDFVAVMTCGHADQACPVIRGADRRVAIPYEDPKAFDGTPDEASAYDARCRRIGLEMLYLFAQVAGAPC